jgi:hypothetical protein
MWFTRIASRRGRTAKRGGLGAMATGNMKATYTYHLLATPTGTAQSIPYLFWLNHLSLKPGGHANSQKRVKQATNR